MSELSAENKRPGVSGKFDPSLPKPYLVSSQELYSLWSSTTCAKSKVVYWTRLARCGVLTYGNLVDC